MGEHFGRGCRQLEGDGEGEISDRKNIFRPQSDTQRGQEQGRKERPHTGDCWVAEERNRRQRDPVAPLVHSLGHESTTCQAWWSAGRVLRWGVCREFFSVGAGSVGAGFSVGARISVGAGAGADAGMTGGGRETTISSGVHSSSSLKVP